LTSGDPQSKKKITAISYMCYMSLERKKILAPSSLSHNVHTLFTPGIIMALFINIIHMNEWDGEGHDSAFIIE